jgi:hypothetical protein
MPDKRVQSVMAFKSGMNFLGKQPKFILTNEYGEIPESSLYVPQFRARCDTCGSQIICNGCSNCGRCEEKE